MFDQIANKDLYSSNFYIDSIQKTKAALTDKVIPDPVLKKAAHNFMDAQATFAKMFADSTAAIVKHNIDTLKNTWIATAKAK